jgi:hypothetical protein
MGLHGLDPQVDPAAAGLHDLARGNQIARSRRGIAVAGTWVQSMEAG